MSIQLIIELVKFGYNESAIKVINDHPELLSTVFNKHIDICIKLIKFIKHNFTNKIVLSCNLKYSIKQIDFVLEHNHLFENLSALYSEDNDCERLLLRGIKPPLYMIDKVYMVYPSYRNLIDWFLVDNQNNNIYTYSDYFEVLQEAYNKGVDINHLNKDGINAFTHRALFKYNMSEMAIWFIKHGSTYNIDDDFDRELINMLLKDKVISLDKIPLEIIKELPQEKNFSDELLKVILDNDIDIFPLYDVEYSEIYLSKAKDYYKNKYETLRLIKDNGNTESDVILNLVLLYL